MKSILANPKSAAITCILLALPFMTIFLLLTLGIEPPLLNNPNPGQPNVLGSLIVLGTFLLLFAAIIIVSVPIVRTMRTGGNLFAHPINLILAGAILISILAVVGAIIVDQYPCWIGVPNCD
jgi:uncharacterized membrane protein YidH (DUF202 family)